MGLYEKSDGDVLWKMFQYVSPMGRAAISDWRGSLAFARQADLDVFLRNLAKQRKWSYPDIRAFAGKDLQGFRELRWRSQGVPHRIGGWFSADDEFVMLLGFTHNAKKCDPPDALNSLIRRRKQLQTGEASISEYRVLTGTRA